MAPRRLLTAVPSYSPHRPKETTPPTWARPTANQHCYRILEVAGVRRKVLPQWMVAEGDDPSPVCQKEFLHMTAVIVTGMLHA